MHGTMYDVFRGRPNLNGFWLGSLTGSDRAIEQMNRIAAITPGDYFVANSATGDVLASIEQSPSLFTHASPSVAYP